MDVVVLSQMPVAPPSSVYVAFAVIRRADECTDARVQLRIPVSCVIAREFVDCVPTLAVAHAALSQKEFRILLFLRKMCCHVCLKHRRETSVWPWHFFRVAPICLGDYPLFQTYEVVIGY